MPALSGYPVDTLDPTDFIAGVNASGDVKLFAASAFGGSPGGSGGAVQYNNTGVLGGASALIWDEATSRLVVGTGFISDFALQVAGTTGNASAVVIGRFSADANDGDLYFYKSRAAAVGAHTIVQDGDNLGAITWLGSDGVTWVNAARIKGVIDGPLSSTGDMPGRLIFETTEDGTISLVERMRITSTGQITIGGFGPVGADGSSRFQIIDDGGTYWHASSIGYGDNNNGVNWVFAKTRNASPSGNTTVQANDGLGSLHFYGSDGVGMRSAAKIRIAADGTPATSTTPGRLEFYTTPPGSSQTPIERVRINSVGSVLINQTTSLNVDSSKPFLGIATDPNGSEYPYVLSAYGNHAFGGSFVWSKTRNASPAAHTVVQTDDAIGRLRFAASDGTNFIRAVEINAEVDGAPGTNDMPGRIVFGTTADGASSVTERMRIDSKGQVSWGFGGASPLIGGDPVMSSIGVNGDVAYAQQITQWGNNIFPISQIFNRTRGSSATNHVVLSPSDLVVVFSFRASNGTGYTEVASIDVHVDTQTPAGGAMPGLMDFVTAPTGGGGGQIRYKIDSIGNNIFGSGLGALATTATAGFIYYVGAPGVPTGVPEKDYTGTIPTLIDTANNRLYARIGGSWVNLSGGGGGINNVVEDTTPELGGNLESNNFDIIMEQYSADAVSANLFFVKSRNAAIGSHTIVQDGDDLGKIIFQGSDGVVFQEAAIIMAEIDGTPGVSADMPGRLLFLVTPNGSATPVERMRLSSGGHLSIGPSPAPDVDGFPIHIYAAEDAQHWTFAANTFGDTGFAGDFLFTKTRNASHTGHTIVQSGDRLGGLWFYGSDGTAFRKAALFVAEIDGTPGANDMPGRFRWLTTPDGSDVVDERMRLDSAGRLMLGGTASVSIGEHRQFQIHGTTSAQMAVSQWSADANGPIVILSKSRSGTIGTNTNITSGDNIGSIQWRTADGTGYQTIAKIEVFGYSPLSQHGGTMELWIKGNGDATGFAAFGMDGAGRIYNGGTNHTVDETLFGQFPFWYLWQGDDSAGGGNNWGGVNPVAFHAYSNDTSAPNFYFGKSRNSTKGVHTIVQAGDGLLYMPFFGSDGTAWRRAAEYEVIVEGTPAASDIRAHFRWRTGAGGTMVERMRLDSVGRVVIGGVANQTSGQLQNHGTTLATSSIDNARWSNDGSGAWVQLYKSHAAGIGTHGLVLTGDTIATIDFYGSDGTNFIEAAKIMVSVDGTAAANDMPGRIQFFTTPDNSASLVERLRIDNQGDIIVGAVAQANIWEAGTTAPRFTIHDTSRAAIGAARYANSAGSSAKLSLAKSRGATIGSMTIVQDGDRTGTIFFEGADGTNFVTAAAIWAEIEGTPGANDMPGRLIFATTTDTASDAIERMRLTAFGGLGIGSGAQTTGFFHVAAPSTVNPAVAGANQAGIKIFAYDTGSGGVNINHYMDIANYSNDGYGDGFNIKLSRGSAAAPAIVQVNDDLGYISFRGGNGAGFTPAARIQASVDGTPGATNDMPGRLTFWTTPDNTGAVVERMRIDNVGRVILGNAAAQTGGRFQNHGTSFVTSSVENFRWSNDSGGAWINLYKSHGGIGVHAIVADGDQIGAIDFYGSDGTVFQEAAIILASVDGTPSLTNDMPGRLTFWTTPDGSITPVERMRIKSDGTFSFVNNTVGAVYSDAGFDVVWGWDDSAGTYKSLLLADIGTEGAPAAGDFVLIYGAEGDLRKVNWSGLPGAGGGINNVVEDTTPELGGNLESNNNDIIMEQFSADAVSADLFFVKSRNAAIGSHTIVQDGDDLGKIIFQGSNGTTFDTAAQIMAEIDGAPGASTDMPGRLTFWTTPDASVTPTERLRIDNQGQITVGGTAALDFNSNSFSATPRFAVHWNDVNTAIGLARWSNTNSGSKLLLAKSRGASIGTHTIVQDGDVIANIAFLGSDGTVFQEAAAIVAAVDGPPSITNDMPGRLMFYTTPDGSITATEKMRISNAGHVSIGGAIAPIFNFGGEASRLQIIGGNSGGDTSAAAIRFSANNSPPRFIMVKSRGAIGVHGLVPNGDMFGELAFVGSDGVAYQWGASIQGAPDGTTAANDMPGKLVFNTTPPGSVTPVERMRINSAGDVSIGGVAPLAGKFLSGAVNGLLQVLGITGEAALGVARFSNGTTPGRIHLAKSRGATVGDYTIVANGDQLGEISFEGSDGVLFDQAAAIRAEVDGIPGVTNDMPGRLVFLTSAEGSITPTERMRIKADGTFSYVNNTVGAVYSDAGFDVVWGWDDTAGTYKSLLLADIATEATPAAGDFLLLYGAEGDLRKVNWSSLPAGGGAPGGSDLQIQYRVNSTTFGGANVWRTGVNQLDLSNGVNPQTLFVYNTTDADGGAPTNFERIKVRFDSNIAYIGFEAGGSANNREVRLGSFGGGAGGIGVSIYAGGTEIATFGVGGISSTLGVYAFSPGPDRPTLNDIGGGTVAYLGVGTAGGSTTGGTAVARNLIAGNGTNATFIYAYNTTDSIISPTNYERGVFNWTTTANTLTIGTQVGGTGTGRDVDFVVPNGNSWTWLQVGSHNALYATGTTFAMTSSHVFGFTSAVNAKSGIDTGLARNSSGVLEINNGTIGAFRDLIVRNLLLNHATDTSFTRIAVGQARYEGITAQTNAVSNMLRLRHSTTGTAAAGIGASIEFEQDTGADNYEIGAIIAAVTTDVGSTTEDFDLVFSTMAGGAAAAERLRISSLNVLSIGGVAAVYADAGADSVWGWDDSASQYANLSAADVRTALGLATTDSPQFAAINVGNASDTTITRAAAGVIAIEGLSLTLADAGADALFAWDDSASTYQNLSAADARAALGLATTDSPQFTALNIGAATDTTLARVSAGVISIEGATIATLSVAQTWTAIQTMAGILLTARTRETEVTLTDGANVTLDSSLGNTFKLTAAGNRQIDAPTNKPASTFVQKIVIAHEASGADRTLTLQTGVAGGFRFGTDITALTATTSGLVDYIGCIYNDADDRWDVVSYVKGF